MANGNSSDEDDLLYGDASLGLGFLDESFEIARPFDNQSSESNYINYDD